jgi:hypothetical protein
MKWTTKKLLQCAAQSIHWLFPLLHKLSFHFGYGRGCGRGYGSGCPLVHSRGCGDLPCRKGSAGEQPLHCTSGSSVTSVLKECQLRQVSFGAPYKLVRNTEHFQASVWTVLCVIVSCRGWLQAAAFPLQAFGSSLLRQQGQLSWTCLWCCRFFGSLMSLGAKSLSSRKDSYTKGIWGQLPLLAD